MNDMETEKPLGFSAMRRLVDPIGYLLTKGFHLLGLFAIGGTAVWAAMKAFFEMTIRGHASIEDLLLLFINLEIGSMVGIYFRTNHMPVRFLLYVAITALTRHRICAKGGIFQIWASSSSPALRICALLRNNTRVKS